MHDTAMKIGTLFFEIYYHDQWKVILDCGAMDVNGSLRAVSPPGLNYIGVDIEFGPSVDVKVDIGSPLPFRDCYADCVVSSSQMEHDDFFWETFLEYCRVVKDGGLIYINAPSNGYYHRYPNDNWRFYPDCGHVLSRWAKRKGFDVNLVESLIADRDGDVWNDFVAVFVKGNIQPNRYIGDDLPCRNFWRNGAAAPEKESSMVQDMDLLQAAGRELEQAQAARRELEQVLAAEKSRSAATDAIESLAVDAEIARRGKSDP